VEGASGALGHDPRQRSRRLASGSAQRADRNFVDSICGESEGLKVGHRVCFHGHGAVNQRVQ